MDSFFQNKIELAQFIDSTLLKTDAPESEFLNLFTNADKYQFKSVCVPPCYVSLAKEKCKKVLVCTVVGFPNGYATTQNKVTELQEALKLGADEIDFVHNLSFVKSNMWSELETQYTNIVKAAHGKVTKLILETALLSDAEIEKCTLLGAKCGISFIKTSTGFASRGANTNDLNIIRSTLKHFFKGTKPTTEIKASGGIRCLSDALNMINLGATRLGTSNGTQIIDEQERRL